MRMNKENIIAQLQQEILQMQGFTPHSGNSVRLGLGPLEAAFPNGVFPTAAVHEFMCHSIEEIAATEGFIAAIVAAFMKSDMVCIWISKSPHLFPPSLTALGITPDRIIFIRLKREVDVLWALEEALKCEGIAAVIGELKDISLTASRRFQLAVEKSHVTGIIIRQYPRDLNTNACTARWNISPRPSELQERMPGIGYPRWNVELQKVRNGKPGVWLLEHAAGKFATVTTKDPRQHTSARKIG